MKFIFIFGCPSRFSLYNFIQLNCTLTDGVAQINVGEWRRALFEWEPEKKRILPLGL